MAMLGLRSARGLSLAVVCGLHAAVSLTEEHGSIMQAQPAAAARGLHAGSAAVEHRFSCSAARGLFPDQDRTRVPCIGR